MRDVSRPISFGLFALVLLVFLLPFARVSCGKQVVVQATGYEVAFGKQVPAQPDSSGGKATWQGRPAQPDFLAIAILVAALVGMGLVRLKGRRGAYVRGIFSFHCMLLPLALYFDLIGKGGDHLQLLAGYWATVALLVLACVVNLIAIRFLPRAAPPGPGAGPTPGSESLFSAGNPGNAASCYRHDQEPRAVTRLGDGGNTRSQEPRRFGFRGRSSVGVSDCRP